MRGPQAAHPEPGERAIGMPRSMWLLVALMVVGALPGCGRSSEDPVVGKWADNASGESLMDWRADGTVVFDVDTDKMEARLRASDPDRAERMKGRLSEMREQVRGQAATWSKSDDLYTVSMTVLGEQQSLRYTLQGEELIPCQQDGTPLARLRYVRVQD